MIPELLQVVSECEQSLTLIWRDLRCCKRGFFEACAPSRQHESGRCSSASRVLRRRGGSPAPSLDTAVRCEKLHNEPSAMLVRENVAFHRSGSGYDPTHRRPLVCRQDVEL